MKYLSLCLLFLITLNQINCVALRRNVDKSALENLHKVKKKKPTKQKQKLKKKKKLAKKSSYTAKIVTAIEMHLTSGGKVDEVLNLVRAALEDVQGRRNALQD